MSQKKNFLFIIAIGLVVLIFSCQSESREKTAANVSSVAMQAGLVKKYVEENTYIDIDVVKLEKEIASPNTRASVDQDKVAQMKAAIYRFYNHVKLKDGFYHCDLTSASQINVSTNVYTALLNNLNDMNADIRKLKEKGQEVTVPDIDEAYLNSLLN